MPRKRCTPLTARVFHKLFRPPLPFRPVEKRLTRGFYAGPVGYISARGSEFGVAIRSALVTEAETNPYGGVPANSQMELFAGCGIVPGSLASSEWAESGMKARSGPVTRYSGGGGGGGGGWVVLYFIPRVSFVALCEGVSFMRGLKAGK